MANLLCLNSNTYHGFPVADAIEGARRAGIHWIELAAVTGWTEHVMPEMSDAELAVVTDQLATADIAVLALGGHSNIATDDGRDQFRRNLRLAARLGAQYVVTGTGETHGDEAHIDDEGALVDDIRELAADAAALGLDIAIETHGANYATGVSVARLVGLVDRPNVGVAYDTGNVIFYGAIEPYDDLSLSAQSVRAFHLKDKRGAQNEWDFPAIGDGDLDLPRLEGVLKRTGCDAPFSIEIEFTPDFPTDPEVVHEAVRRSVAAIDGAGLGA